MLYVYVCVWEAAFGVDGGWTPLPTRAQRYCNPASLVPSLPIYKEGVSLTSFYICIRLSRVHKIGLHITAQHEHSMNMPGE